MISNTDAIVVLGGGSIGERHIGILQNLGYHNIHLYRQRNLPLRTIDPQRVQVFTNFDQIKDIAPKAAILCTPTSLHISQARACAEQGIHVLVEKPLSHTPEGIRELRQVATENQVLVQVAYMLRYHPHLQRVKQVIEEGTFGRLLSMQSYWGEYLPDWHPWEDYRTSYAARKELGGGAALTLSHDLDLLNWLAGSPVSGWNILKNHTSSLEVDVEAGADILLSYQSGLTAHCHLNFYERTPRRYYRFVLEEGTLELDYYSATLNLLRPGHSETDQLENFDRNQLFESQTRVFIDRLNSGSFTSLTNAALDESELIIKICNS
ncbi:Gfo/Idh/MocA family oxidoreductase [Telluribacter sp.]|jgi:predicted dehydrogenase|uniref:Gfo/Idh/MocA family protein n=1 Tax=Telluribacter sp. TaxID=1978767 RepID=UPI002E14E763|nr:Gfo/Idh/MocA family oxidoreductase [Telluribacter sp.]